MNKLNFKGYESIPEHTKMALRMYVEEGYMPGGFLTAVLCNDLFRAVDHADSETAAALVQIVKFIYNRVPNTAWGSAQQMRHYISRLHDENLVDELAG